jgi:hypothetical protein
MIDRQMRAGLARGEMLLNRIDYMARLFYAADTRNTDPDVAIPPTPTDRADAARVVTISTPRLFTKDPAHKNICYRCGWAVAVIDGLCLDCTADDAISGHPENLERALRLIHDQRPVRLPWYVNLAFWIAEHTGAI